MNDSNIFISKENREILSKIYNEIDPKEDLLLLQNPRRLGIADHQDIRNMVRAGMTIHNLFVYANRPKNEVLQYMLQKMPDALDGLLTNIRKKKGKEF